jgi:hypothetical protein
LTHGPEWAQLSIGDLSEIALAMGRAMPTCDCCLIERADAQVRAGLYPKDAQGKESDKAFVGFYVTNALLTHAVQDRQKIFDF